MLLLTLCPPIRAEESHTPWPKSEPYKTGYLNVSPIHEIFYQLGGNPKGKPVMVLHGGPGGSCSPNDLRMFNPEKFHVILHDQRGAGKSKPGAELKENTTWTLVEDIETLRKTLNLGKVIILGGSWGSTLALAYAEKYPGNVAGLILRGVFTATRQEIDHFYHGGVATFFPEVFEKLAAVIPDPNTQTYPAQLLEQLKKPDAATREKFAQAWAAYEIKLAGLNTPDFQVQEILTYIKNSIYAFALLENYYMANNCFLKEGQLLNDTDKIKEIPTIIVQGRYDVICPPIAAWRLHKKLPRSKLFWAEGAGHSAYEPTVLAKLIKAVKEFE